TSRTGRRLGRLVSNGLLRGLLASGIVVQMLVPVTTAPTYAAADQMTAAFSGAGTATAGTPPVLYARPSTALTLTVNTDPDTQCVVVTGAFSADKHVATSASTWTFPVTASGSGAQTITATAGSKYQDNNQNCNTNRGSTTAS